MCHVPAARDEYASYADQVFSMLIKDAGTDVIAAYLTQISSDQMGLLNNDETIENDKAVADILVEWKEILLGP